MQIEGTWWLSHEDEGGDVDTRAKFALKDGVISDAESKATIGRYTADPERAVLELTGSNGETRERIIATAVKFDDAEAPRVLSATVIYGAGTRDAICDPATLHRIEDAPFTGDQIAEDVRFDDSDFPF